MAQSLDVAVLVGSLRKESISRQGARAGEGHLKVIQSDACGRAGVLEGVQDVAMEFAGKAQSMKPRITEDFRRQGGAWKLVHRHADMNAGPKGR